jgi:hypothetical protein
LPARVDLHQAQRQGLFPVGKVNAKSLGKPCAREQQSHPSTSRFAQPFDRAWRPAVTMIRTISTAETSNSSHFTDY